MLIVTGRSSFAAAMSLSPSALTGCDFRRIRGMLQVRDAVREVFRTQLSRRPRGNHRRGAPASEPVVRFVRFPVRAAQLPGQNVRAFADDPDHPLLLSLEEFNPETKLATKTAIFERRTLERYRPVERVETASEALLVSLNETGQINWPRMEALTGKSRIRFAGRTGLPGIPKS